MGEAAIKAGLIGAVVSSLLISLKLIPLAGTCLFLFVDILVWISVGYLTVHWLPLPKQPSIALGTGGVAGLIAGLLSGLFLVILGIGQYFWFGGASGLMSHLPKASTDFYSTVGVSPAVLFSGTGLALSTILICLLNLLLAVVISALSATLFARSPR